MKNFPRIYSLCTVGLIHHGEYEYLFHPFRTDFVGDSGSGKSMVADLLQLILVGSDEFDSATEVSGEKRTADGMVLAINDTGGVGYAFLNVEVASKQYIVVGAYLQNGNQRTRAFVAQAGNVFSGNSLIPLPSPLSYDELIRQADNAILPLEQLGSHLLGRDVILRTYERFSDFHGLLIANNLLPLKSNADQQALKDYATIIRSFARGYKVKADKSNALQRFLFGRSERNSLLDKIRHVQQDIDKNIQSHNQNADAVDDFKAKLAHFKDLFHKETEHKQAKTNWITANYYFTQHVRKQRQQNVEQMYQCLNTEFARLAAIRPVIDGFRDTLPNTVESTKITHQNAVSKKIDLDTIAQSVATVQKWLNAIGPTATLEQLADIFKIDQKRREQRQRIDTLLKLLSEAGLTNIFLTSAWTEGYEPGYEQSQQQLNTLDALIREKTQLVLLANLDDPTSLSYWASRLDRTLTLAEESVLRHFQQFPTTKPTVTTGDRYIPVASALFDELPIVVDEANPETYWANLAGIWERIQQVKDPLFTTNDKQALQEKLRQWNSELQTEIKQLTEKHKALSTLSTSLRGISDIHSLLAAYIERTQVNKFDFNSEWAMVSSDFEKLLTQHRTYASRIEVDLQQAKKAVDEALIAFTNVSQQDTWLDQAVQLINGWSLPKEYTDALSQLMPNRPEYTLHTDELLADPADSGLKTLLADLRMRHQNRVTINRWCDELTLLSEAELKQREAEEDYLALFDKTPVESVVVDEGELSKLHNKADQTWAVYKDNYERLADHYLKGQKYTIDDPTCNFMALAHEVLPLPLRKTINSADDVIAAIELELVKINNQVRLIADSIIRDAGGIVAQLGQIIDSHKKAQAAIQRFFQNQTIPITNNCSVKLTIRQGELKQDWIAEFADLIDSLETPLFPSTAIDADSLRNKRDVTDLIRTAFKQANSGKNPAIDLIFDPFNYYELSFGMYYENGQPNKGSTGQTYAALALLSIARLSIIEAGSPTNPAPGLRIMPIDEAEGLGSNFTMLADIARQYDYQLIVMSIGPVGRYQENEQHVYMLHKDQSTDEAINYPPFGILSAQDAHLLTYRYDAKN